MARRPFARAASFLVVIPVIDLSPSAKQGIITAMAFGDYAPHGPMELTIEAVDGNVRFQLTDVTAVELHEYPNAFSWNIAPARAREIATAILLQSYQADGQMPKPMFNIGDFIQREGYDDHT